jgi:hypothetical protein
MAGQKLTQKTALNSQTGSGDLFMIVDVNDTTGSADGTSKKLDSKFVIQTDKISVTTAEFQSMDTTGGAGTFRTLISAPGAGYAIVPLNVFINGTFTSGSTSNTILYLGFVSTLTQQSWGTFGKFMGSGANTSYSFQSSNVTKGSLNALNDDKPFVMYANQNFTEVFSADVYVTYNIIQL